MCAEKGVLCVCCVVSFEILNTRTMHPHRMPHRMPAFPGPGDRKSTQKRERDVAKERGMCTYTAAKRERRGPRMHVHRSPSHFSFLTNTPYTSDIGHLPQIFTNTSKSIALDVLAGSRAKFNIVSSN